MNQATEMIEEIKNSNDSVRKDQCRHAMPDGQRCGSPALRDEKFCYYHHDTRKPIANSRQRHARGSSFRLAAPDSRVSIQESLGEILTRIASNDIDPRRAGLLLYGLQIACTNLSGVNRTAASSSATADRVQSEPEPPAFEEEDSIDSPEERKSLSKPVMAALLESLGRYRGEIPCPDEQEAASDPQFSDPQFSDPQFSSEPQPFEPQSSEAQSSEPQPFEPQSSEAQSSEPQSSSEIQSSEPQPPSCEVRPAILSSIEAQTTTPTPNPPDSPTNSVRSLPYPPPPRSHSSKSVILSEARRAQSKDLRLLSFSINLASTRVPHLRDGFIVAKVGITPQQPVAPVTDTAWVPIFATVLSSLRWESRHHRPPYEGRTLIHTDATNSPSSNQPSMSR